MVSVKSPLGLLLLHSIGSDHHEMDFLVQEVSSHGYIVEAPNLPGHGTSLKEMRRTSLADQKEFVRGRIHSLLKTCDRVVVGGQSLGSLLALSYAEESPAPSLAGVILLSTPFRFWFSFLRASFFRWTGPFLSCIPSFPRLFSLVRNKEARRELNLYSGWSGRSVADLLTLMSDVEQGLERIHHPVLAVHSKRDFVSHPKGMDVLQERLLHPAKLVWIEEGGHLVSVDYERERVASAILEFMNKLSTTTGDNA